VEWAEELQRSFETGIVVTVTNGKGVLARVAAALAAAEVDINHVNMGDEEGQDTTDLRFVISVRDRAHLELALQKLQRIPAVLSAVRAKPASNGN
jgi:GTP pyrophosphokinase